ncbi:MAG: hypothetical protein SOV85_01885 [Clostridium sp.]|uniref:hypothetical protein n=1 Tax=Clostridium sp. TaxID=1506 RepID=UPI002A75C359|nr:hypothetical protein [Clostridium sp.]MDY2630094.1 hypothetical protein [Clostridium sp.]
MIIINGNILDVEKGIICQQVNCCGVMGSGLALQIKYKYPIVYEKYIEFVNFAEMKNNNLGETLLVEIDNDLYIANLFAQFSYGRGSRIYTDYEMFKECLERLKNTIDNNEKLKDLPIYFPYKIGCGLGKGDWNVISNLIEKRFPHAVIVKLEGDK